MSLKMKRSDLEQGQGRELTRRNVRRSFTRL